MDSMVHRQAENKWWVLNMQKQKQIFCGVNLNLEFQRCFRLKHEYLYLCNMEDDNPWHKGIKINNYINKGWKWPWVDNVKCENPLYSISEKSLKHWGLYYNKSLSS